MRRLIMLVLLLSAAVASSAEQPRITILSDAFSRDAALHKDWGFSALVEWEGQRILFDAGNHSGHLLANAEHLKVDLGNLDFAVVSHRHGDHTNGLREIVALNPGLTIYVPQDEHFGGDTPRAFFRQGDPSLPAHMRYYDGVIPDAEPHGTLLPKAGYVLVGEARDLAPGLRLVANLSPGPAFTETPEISLIVGEGEERTLIVGCSHPGIERILESADARRRPLELLVGGFHRVTTAAVEVRPLSHALRDDWKVRRVAPGHCSGEQTFAALRAAYGDRWVYAGVGERINETAGAPSKPLPPVSTACPHL